VVPEIPQTVAYEESDQVEMTQLEFKRLLEETLNDPSVTIEIEEHVPQPQYGPWAKVAKFSGGLYGRDRQRQRERERATQRRRQQLGGARSRSSAA